MNDKEQNTLSLTDKYTEIMRQASLTAPITSQLNDLSQPSPLEIIDSITTSGCYGKKPKSAESD